MTTRYVERTREGWRLKRLLGWALVVGSGLTIVAFALAARSVGDSDEPELAAFASELAPAPVPVPTPPPAEEQPYVSGTPAPYTLVTAKLLPEMVAVPMPPVPETTGTALQAAQRLSEPSIPDRLAHAQGSATVVPGGLMVLTILGLVGWISLRRAAKTGLKQAKRKGSRCTAHTRNSNPRTSSSFG
jgi:hypothetical protein